MDLKQIITEEIHGQKLYYHGRKSGSRPYNGEYIYITDDLGYASGYSDGKILYVYTLPFGKEKIFSIKNTKHLRLLSQYIDRQAVELILSTSGGDEMDWAAITYIDNDDYDSPEDLFIHLGFYGMQLKERQGIESLYIFDEKKLDFKGTIDITTPQMIQKIRKFYKDFEKDKNFLQENRNEVLDELHALLTESITEGVADKYAERQFNMPDPNTAMDYRATQAMPKENSQGEFINNIYDDLYMDDVQPVEARLFKNPRSLEGFGKNIRGVSDYNGNFFLADNNGNFLHDDMISKIPNGRGKSYIHWYRIHGTNIFGLSGSYINGHRLREEDEKLFIEKVQKNNPYANFRAENSNYLRTTTKIKEGITDEGVADVYAEKAFNVQNPMTAMNNKAMNAGVNNEDGKHVANVRDYGSDEKVMSKIFLNPKSLRNFSPEVRAISDKNNNLFVAQADGYFAHYELGNAIIKAGYDIGESSYEEELNITWKRHGNTNAFGLADSMTGYFERDETQRKDIIDRTAVLQRKFPQFKFITKVYYELKDSDVFDNTHMNEMTDEGVADKFAEKHFNIPDQGKAMDQRAVAAMPKDNSAGELIAELQVYNYGKYDVLRVFMNPRSLQTFQPDVKALSDNDGDLIIAESDLPIYHADIMGAVEDGKIYKKPVYGAYDERHYITLHRIGSTDEFGWSVSYKKFGGNPANAEKVQLMMNAVKNKNPRFTFTPQYWHDIKNGKAIEPWTPDDDDDHDNDFDLHDMHWKNEEVTTDEGVADKAAERMFHITDPNKTMDQRAIQGTPRNNSIGTFVGDIVSGSNFRSKVYVNPRNLDNYEAGVRALSDNQNNLFVAQLDADFYHINLANAIKKNPNYDIGIGAYDSDNNITWIRVKKTNIFGLAESMEYYVDRDEKVYEDVVRRTIELQNYHKNIRFIPRAYYTIDPLNPNKDIDADDDDESTFEEGVADKYAEKNFNIPDSNTEQDLRAMQGILGKPFTVINLQKKDGEVQRVPIYKNPQSLQGFQANVRAIAVRHGDLFVMQIDADVMHGKMGWAIGLKNVYDTDDTVLLHRVGDTNEFGFGDSASGWVERNERNWKISVDILRKTKQVNPQFDYYPIYFQKVLELELSPIDAGGNDEYENQLDQFDEGVATEGVADKYAEKAFNIPDDNTAMDRKATAGIPVDNNTENNNDPKGVLVGQSRAGNEVLRVFMNPRSLNDFEENVKAVSNAHGDLFIAENDLPIYHSNIIDAVEKLDVYEQPLYGAYDEEYNVTWHRLGNTDEFGWSVSYRDFGRRPENYPKVVEMQKAVEAKNPTFTFYRRYWNEILQQRYDDRHNVNNDSILNYESVVREAVEDFISEEMTEFNDRLKDGFMPGLKKELEEQQAIEEGYNDDKGLIKLYHRISGKEMKLTELMKSVLTNGLIPHDNGEVGNVIWFSDDFKDYGKDGSFVVSLDFDTATNGVTNNEFEIVYSGHNAFAHKQIPFDRLEVVKIPVGIINGNYIQSNVDMIRNISKGFIKAENVNTGYFKLLIFEDIFKLYVEPHIGTDFLQQLDRTKVKMINIL